MNIESQITQTAIEAVKQLYGQEVSTDSLQPQKTKSNFQGKERDESRGDGGDGSRSGSGCRPRF